MGATTSTQHEHAEVDAIVQSGLFDKAPRLGKFFVYICDRYFEGNADQIKEYSIAVEALGRSAEFDSKRDSIVRVEAHRLRKRLDEFYKGPGADHQVHVLIPNGQYRPHFVLRETPPPVEEVAAASISLAASGPAAAGLSAIAARPWILWIAAGAIVTLAAGLTSVLLMRHHKPAAPQSEVWAGTFADPVPAEFRMLAGYHGAPLVDRQGHTWSSDAYYTGGVSLPMPPDHLIEGAPDPRLFKAERTGNFHYDIPVSVGTHELRLYFTETEYGRGNPKGGGEGSRTFDLSLNGQVIDRVFDPLAEAGAPNRLYVRVMKDVRPAADQKIHLGFNAETANATLNAIEILSSTPGRVQPIRIVTQSAPVTDSDGRVWAADEYFYSGTLAFRRDVLLDRPERILFQGERYGNFSYHIPLAPGKYKLTLHFVETWFGTPNSNNAPLDSRVFDVYANGVALLRDFVVGIAAGGPNRIIERTFDNLEPNAQGVLLLEFVPVKNYAEVNAIEVVQSE